MKAFATTGSTWFCWNLLLVGRASVSGPACRSSFRIGTYLEFVSLSIWSITEISVGIVVANLPPLRKSLDGTFRDILPDSITDKVLTDKLSPSHAQSYDLPTHRSQVTRRSTIEAMTGRSARQTADSESYKAHTGRLESEYISKMPSNMSIIRATRVTVDHMISNEKSTLTQGTIMGRGIRQTGVAVFSMKFIYAFSFCLICLDAYSIAASYP
jgi:hypothetical protein